MLHKAFRQGIIYPVSHRSLRIEFGALRNNCELQNEKARIEKIKRETVQLCIANGDRSRWPAIIIRLYAAPAKAASGPIHVSAQARSVRVDDGWSKPHQPTANVTATSFANIKKEIVFAQPSPSHGDNKRFSWCKHAGTFMHFTNSGVHCFVFLKPDVPGEWLHFDESTKGKSSRIRCLLRSKHGERLRATRTSFLQGVRNLQWKKKIIIKDTLVKNCKADNRPFSHEQQPTPSTVNEKIMRSMKLRKVTRSASLEEAGGSRVSRLLGLDLVYMTGRRLTTRFLSSWSWREGMVRACLGQNVQQHAQMSKFCEHDRETTQEIRNNRWMHTITLCMPLSVYCTA